METNPLDLPRIYQVLADYSTALQKAYKDKLADEKHNASGKLSSSIEWRIDQSGRQYIISLRLEDYWKNLEDGRRPGKCPPIDRIREWVRVKPVVPNRDAQGKLPTIRQLAYLISRKIGEKGVKPTLALERTIKEINAEYLPKIQQAFAEDLQDSLLTIFTDVFRQE